MAHAASLFLPGPMPPIRRSFAAISFLVCAVPPALAADRTHIAVPESTLGIALPILARQTGISIGGVDPGIAATPSRRLSGKMRPAEALDQLLKDTPFRAAAIDAFTYRIVRRASTPRLDAATDAGAGAKMKTGVGVKAQPTVHAAPSDIVVLASKRSTLLSRFPGGALIVPLRGAASPNEDASDINDVVRTVPILQSTGRGVGRDKLFIRGIVDSSFTGPTQSTVGTYLGDVRLGYNGPDPSLNLYDMSRVEILEGPQGTLYGAGSIGGIIRLVPNAPDLFKNGGQATAGFTMTQNGAPGYDAAAMENIVLASGNGALRLVGYSTRSGGYIDDIQRGQDDINSVDTHGGRAMLRIAPGNGWTIDASFVGQRTDAADSQYATSGLERTSGIAQPFRDRFLLGNVVVTKQWDSGLHLLSSFGAVSHHTSTRFDATQIASVSVPIAYDEKDRMRLLSYETRLWRTFDNGGSWLLGMMLSNNRDILRRQIGPLSSTRDLTGVTNRTIESALFGEGALPLDSRMTLTVGGRLTRARMDGEPSATARVNDFVRGNTSVRFDPSIGLSLAVKSRLLWYMRYQQGFRTGGLAVAPGKGRTEVYRSDAIHVVESGFRLQRSGALGLAGNAAVSLADWRHIQADLIRPSGFIYTANVGSGRVLGFEAMLDYNFSKALNASAGLFLNDSRLNRPAPEFGPTGDHQLPDTPRFSAYATLNWTHDLPSLGQLGIKATIRYTGSSRLGVGPLLDIRQGNYAESNIGANLTTPLGTFGLSVDNIANAEANRFSLGNPFTVAQRNQGTPLRPRNVRLSISRNF